MQILNFIIPTVCVALCWLALTRAGVHRRLVPPLAFAGGQGLWFALIVAFVFLFGGNAWPLFLDTCIDLVAIPLLVAMIARRPPRPSLRLWLYALVAYEGVSLALNLTALAGMTGALVVALLVHVGIRTTVIVTAVLALRHLDEIGPRDTSS
jgi:hypothetical protein